MKQKTPNLKVKISEQDFMNQVIELAHYLGWRVVHFRSVKVQRKDGSVFYQTPVQADGAGFPDVVMIRGERIIVAELKTEKGKVTAKQEEWLDAFRATGRVEVFLWRPSDYEAIVDCLR